MVRSTLAAVLVLLALGGCTDGTDRSPHEAGPTTTAPPFFPGPAAAPEPVAHARVRVFFVDVSTEPPELVAVERTVPATDIARNAAVMVFAGPRPEEAERGLRLVTSGVSGVASVTVVDGVATAHLVGGCGPADEPFSVADLLIATLKSVGGVQVVKLLAPDGSTQAPRGPEDSVPSCLT